MQLPAEEVDDVVATLTTLASVSAVVVGGRSKGRSFKLKGAVCPPEVSPSPLLVPTAAASAAW